MLLGVDGGGTATALCLADEGGRVLALDFRPAVSPSGRYGTPAEILGAGIAGVCSAAGVEANTIEGAFFALPYVGEDRPYSAELRTTVERLLGHDRVDVDNDMVAGWAGSLAGEDGVNVIAGTGSLAFGVRGPSRARVGGWGPPFGDEGSGWSIAVEGLRAFTHMADGRRARGPLHRIVHDALGLEADLDLAGRFARSAIDPRSSVASLAPLVVQAAGEGDVVAQRILDDAADALAACADATIADLSWAPGETIPVSYSGGVFAAPAFPESFAASLARRRPSARVTAPALAPVLGAVLLAARVAGSRDHGALLAGLRAARVPAKTAGGTGVSARHSWVTSG